MSYIKFVIIAEEEPVYRHTKISLFFEKFEMCFSLYYNLYLSFVGTFQNMENNLRITVIATT